MKTKVKEKNLVQEKFMMQDIFEKMDHYGHEQVIFCRHVRSGLKAIIALHDLTLGPALGGCRMIPYSSTNEALEDALKLSKGMTYKCGAADVDFGGGKMVIIGDESSKSPELFRAAGRFVETLGKRFFTGTDMGTKPEDFIHAAKESNSILGLPTSFGGSGDTSILTSLGLLHGMKATAFHLWGSNSLHNKVVAIQGVGKVGNRLLDALLQEGAYCILSDIHHEHLRDLEKKHEGKVQIANMDEIYRMSCDILSPCARGGVINDNTIEELQCKAIVGAANNQLAEDRHGDMLYEKGILYAPDYVVNSGGLIQVADEVGGYCKERSLSKTESIYKILSEIYERSQKDGIPTCRAADKIVIERLDKVADIRRIFLGCS